MKYEEYFESKYEYALKEINYRTIPSPKDEVLCQQTLNDNLVGQIDQNNKLHLLYTRTVFFQPEYIYSLKISYEIHLTFKKSAVITPVQDGEYWAKRFLNEQTNLFTDICSRISLIISNITNSDGKSPLILPPQPVGVFANKEQG